MSKCCRMGPKLDRIAWVSVGQRKPLMRRSRSRVGWWLFLVRLLTRALALTKRAARTAGQGSGPEPPGSCAAGR